MLFCFFKIIGNIVALEHGKKKKDDQNSTGSDIKHLKNRISKIQNNTPSIFSEILTNKNNLIQKIKNIDSEIRELEYHLANKLDGTLNTLRDKLEEKNEFVDLDENQFVEENDKKNNTISISLDLLKNLWKDVSKRDKLKEEQILCKEKILNINKIIRNWNITTSISKTKNKLYLLSSTKGVFEFFFSNFYEYYYNKTENKDPYTI